MRERKYRAYTYTPSRGWFMVTSDQCGSLSAFFRWHEGDEITDFTGLHDKNGVEIFESDIVKSEWGHHLVSYEETEAGFMVLNNDRMICGCLSGSIGFNCEVIGNLYESPELLT